jgi:hypothetical protein
MARPARILIMFFFTATAVLSSPITTAHANTQHRSKCMSAINDKCASLGGASGPLGTP